MHLRRGLNPYECEKYVCKLMEVQPTTLARAYDPTSQAINKMESVLSSFLTHVLTQIDRGDNVMADTLFKLFQGDTTVSNNVVYFEELSTPTVDLKEVMEIGNNP